MLTLITLRSERVKGAGEQRKHKQQTNLPQHKIQPPIRIGGHHLTSWSQHGIDTYSVRLITSRCAGDQVDGGLGVVVVMRSDCPVVHGPQALVRVLVCLNDEIHAITEKQRLQTGSEQKKTTPKNNYGLVSDAVLHTGQNYLQLP